MEKARRFRERAHNIDNRYRGGRLLNRTDFLQDIVPQFLEELIFQIPCPFVSAKNLRYHILELRRDETLAADGRLLARVVRRHVSEIAFRDLDEITEDGIEPDLERFDPSGRDLALLQFGDPVFAVARRLSQLVKIDIVAVA